MELKQQSLYMWYVVQDSLNRTFYGIETNESEGRKLYTAVLIVPFMELKQ